MPPLGKRGETREKVYRFVRRRLLEGKPPTVREIADALGFRAVQTAQLHLETLAAEGRLVRNRGRARGWALPARKGPPIQLVPLLGEVQAGTLTEAIEHPEGYIPVQARVRGDLFALRVRGESMTGAGILPGDVVVVRQQRAGDSGDIVVALVENEATVKRLRVHQRRIELHPENPAFSPIIPEGGTVRILGRVVEVRRDLSASSVSS